MHSFFSLLRQYIQRFFVTSMLLIALGCGTADWVKAAYAKEPPLEKVRLQLKWMHQFQFAGYYAAQKKGFFRDAGLDVTLLAAEPELRPADVLMEGKANYAVMSPVVLIERNQGRPFVALASIFQHSASIFMGVRGHGIQVPQDLRGKKIMFTADRDAENLAMLVASGVSLESVRSVDHSWNLEDLINGKVDVQTAYLTNEPYVLQQRGVDPVVLKPVDYGIDFYGDCLVTTEQEIRRHPERTEHFLQAVRRGWRYALEHPKEIAQLICDEYSQQKSIDQLLYEARTMRELIQPNLVEIGYMSRERWRFIAETYVRLGMLPEEYSLHDFLYSEILQELQKQKHSRNILLLGGLSIALLVGSGGGILLLFFTKRLNSEVDKRTHALSVSEQKFRSFFELASVGVAQVDAYSGRFLEVNQRYCEIVGYTEKEMQQFTFRDVTVAEDLDLDVEQRRELIKGTIREFTVEKRYQHKDGSVVWVILSVSALWQQGERAHTSLAIIRDITKRKKAEEDLVFAAKVFEQSIEGIVVADSEGSILQVNQAFTAITGYEAQEVIGENPRILKSNHHPLPFYESMWQELLQKGHWAGEIWNRRKNGEIYPEWLTINAIYDPRGRITNFVSIFHDITELKHQQEALEHQAQHDALTGLPNRFLLNDRLREALKRMDRNHQRVALIFLDLDNFKHINDGFGHTTGDDLLVELSSRLKDALRAGDTLSRQGGDEFLVLVSDIEEVDDVSTVALRLLACFEKPFFHEGVEFFVTASVGITIAPEDGENAEVLIKNADMAMYRAKNLGRNNFQYFTPELDSKAHRRISLEAKLRKGIEAEEFELHYQPQVHCATNTIIGAEALVRWRSEGQLISPVEFIPLAEESGLILPLGAWVVRTAARQAKQWQDQGYELDISVNISSRQFVGQELTNLLREVLLTTGLRGGRLYFEITESILMEDIVKAQATLEELRQLGGKFYLDDFGTGYSSLSYLKRLPLDGLKIDRSFVKDLENDSDSQAIAKAIVSLAQTLNLVIVAEGVETAEQLALLEMMSKETIVQGYLASRPLPADEFAALLAQDEGLLPVGKE
ncbi:EAL domain-containing protein [Desulfobulbus rhabdoformis]|uniref:EAL domain-containing protein n=1 Tax=Desulfobulbus rhabdoformis TaxID=34032 RepID=UPI001965D5FD|nr:EAL domain-containing protein [Desulfobulbus rhabdoformis]MBM9613465.1 EAL domain-containing protein [Desulfobulbus rhabdoformis]